MIETFRELLAPHYIIIKFFHLLSVMIWAWSTLHAFSNYLAPAFRAWNLNPGDVQRLTMRNWTMERFDDGVIYEHIAFPIVLITGVMLYVSGGWTTASYWLLLKLSIVVSIMVPIEIFDYYLSHLGGNKRRIRRLGDSNRYETMIHWHWWFLLITSPLIMVFVLLIIFLAVIKPF